MSEDRPPADDGTDRPPSDDAEDRHLDTEETSGLGLTEEFARIEAEIGDATGEQPEASGPAEGAEGEDGGTVEWEAPTGEDEEWVVEGDGPATGESGAWDAPEGETPHDTGEWIGATGETGAETGGSDPRHTDTQNFDPIAEEGSGEHEIPSGESTEQDAAPEPASTEQDAPAEPAPAEPEAPPEPSEPATRVHRDEPLVPAGAAAAAARGDAPTEVRRPDAPGQLTPIPPGPPVAEAGDDVPEVKVPSLWWRFLSGSVLIVASVAASVAIAGLFFFGDIAAKLHPIKGISDQLTQVESHAPQTVLIIGSDRRAGNAIGDARSDTTMLLRVDPDKGVLSLFSLPRDLSVDIPGYGQGKLNEAYTYGGEKLTLKTVHKLTGLDINHVVEINFQGFADAVNAIDCVYVDVDHHYYHSNAGLSDLDSYSEIDIGSGYQRLCGEKALQYVRYRHTDNDVVRAARQQDFLREARQKVEPRELIPGHRRHRQPADRHLHQVHALGHRLLGGHHRHPQVVHRRPQRARQPDPLRGRSRQRHGHLCDRDARAAAEGRR